MFILIALLESYQATKVSFFVMGASLWSASPLS